MTDTDTLAQQWTTEPPPMRWQNVWRARIDLRTPGVEPVEAGSLIRVNHFHAAAYIARLRAKAELDEMFARQGVFGTYDHILEYLGAYPQGVGPTEAER